MQKRLKKGAVSLTGIEFILNVIAVIIAIVALTSIIRLSYQSAVYTRDSRHRIALNYILFSEEGYMPDRYVLDVSRLKDLRIPSINDIGLRFLLDTGEEYYFNENYFEINYPLRTFDKFYYGSINKPVLLVDGLSKKISYVTIEFIFRREEAPRAVGVNS